MRSGAENHWHQFHQLGTEADDWLHFKFSFSLLLCKCRLPGLNQVWQPLNDDKLQSELFPLLMYSSDYKRCREEQWYRRTKPIGSSQ